MGQRASKFAKGFKEQAKSAYQVKQAVPQPSASRSTPGLKSTATTTTVNPPTTSDVAAAAASSIPHNPLASSYDDYNDTLDSHSAVVRSDPSAEITGFRREKNASDDKQLAYLRSRSTKAYDDVEMAPDLIKFLTDAGPLTKHQVDNPASTSDNTQPYQQQTQRDTSRRTERMPLAQLVPGYETMRTNSFSRKVDVVDPKDFSVGSVVDLYRLVQTTSNNNTTTTSLSIEQVHDNIAQRLGVADWTDDERAAHLQLLQDARTYLSVPVLLWDTDADGDVVGCHPSVVADLPVDSNQVLKTKALYFLEHLCQVEDEMERVKNILVKKKER
jgi:hypothetical protein